MDAEISDLLCELDDITKTMAMRMRVWEQRKKKPLPPNAMAASSACFLGVSQTDRLYVSPSSSWTWELWEV